MGVNVPPNQVVAAFLPKVLNQRIPELVEFCGAESVSHLVRELVAQAIENMDASRNVLPPIIKQTFRLPTSQ